MLWPLAAKMTTKMANTDHYPKTASLFASLPAVYVHTSTEMHQERIFCRASWIQFLFRGARASMYHPLCEGIFFIMRKVRGGYSRHSIFPNVIFATTFPLLLLLLFLIVLCTLFLSHISHIQRIFVFDLPVLADNLLDFAPYTIWSFVEMPARTRKRKASEEGERPIFQAIQLVTCPRC